MSFPVPNVDLQYIATLEIKSTKWHAVIAKAFNERKYPRYGTNMKIDYEVICKTRSGVAEIIIILKKYFIEK